MVVLDENRWMYDRFTQVLIRGNMTVETNGFLISNAASIPIRSVSNNKYVYQFDNCYETKSSESFSQSGDSGAIVFAHVQDCHERTKNPFGITIAFSADGTTCAC